MDPSPATAPIADLQPILPSPEWIGESGPLPVPESRPPQRVTAPSTSPTPPHDEPINHARRLVQGFTAFLCLFLVIRTIGLEPFGVPTGSMAPTVFGNHREGECPRCGFRVVVGEPSPEGRPVAFEKSRCPNCDATVDLKSAREVPGDRLMVDKTAFNARKPRRWEVAVFHCPADSSKPYVKRVVGLPGETIRISDGDVYVGTNLLRKNLSQIRETRILLFDMNYVPAPDGWAQRWIVEPLATDSKALSKLKPMKHPDNDILHDDVLTLDGVAHPEGIGLTYRHYNLDTKDEEPIGDWLAYNGGPTERRTFGRKRADGSDDSIHDFMVEFDLTVNAGAGRFACRLTDGADRVYADFPIGDDSTPEPLSLAVEGGQLNSQSLIPPLKPGHTYRVEFALVDRRACLAIDGVEVPAVLDLAAAYSPRPTRAGVRRPVQFGIRGASIDIKNFKIYRDIHYLMEGPPGNSWTLGSDEYFFLGDNSASSSDSRAWKIENRPRPGVPESNFIGKPFFIHQPLRLAHLTINGRSRAFQTLDWSRLHWLR